MGLSTSGQSAYPILSMLTATSSTKTPTASGNYQSMTGNSLTLTAGTWQLSGKCDFLNSGSAPAYTQLNFGIWGANGADTSSVPATTLSGVANLTVNSANDNMQGIDATITGNQAVFPLSPIVVTVTANATVYAVPFATMTTAANSRITVYFNAQRLY